VWGLAFHVRDLTLRGVQRVIGVTGLGTVACDSVKRRGKG
jgi:hypothetical protein